MYYVWKDIYETSDVAETAFLKATLLLLKEGAILKDIEGNVVGRASTIDGGLGLVTITSNDFIQNGTLIFTQVAIIYLNKVVATCYYSLKKAELNMISNGHWANRFTRYLRERIKN